MQDETIIRAWRRLAIAILKKACKDEGVDFLNTNDGYFFKVMSKTENNDYKKACEYYAKKHNKSIDKTK